MLSIKLKQARLKENKTQKELAEWMQEKFDTKSGHSIISQYETGQITGVSDAYIEFLVQHGFDLNSLFNPKIKDIVKIGEPYTYVNPKDEPAMHLMNEQAATYGRSKEDKYIAFLEQTMESLQADKTSLQRTIDQLQEQLKYMRS